MAKRKKKVDQKHYDFLMNAIEANQTSGFDFLKFKKSLQALADIDMEEAMRYKSAFATASTFGVSLDHLMKSADYYRDVMAREKQKFDTAVQSQIQQKVIARQEHINGLNKNIQAHQAKIQELNVLIEKTMEEINTTRAEIDAVSTKIEDTKSNFSGAYDKINQEINEDVENIKMHLS